MATRDPEGTKARILDAAKEEFAAKGLAGARVDAIARAARVNKRMLYHYFGNKRDLYREVVHRQVLAHGTRTEGNPTDPVEALPYWYEETSSDVAWTRLLAWEALEDGGGRGVTVGADELRRNYDTAVGWIRQAQSAGLLDPSLDPELYLLATIALNMFPNAFPQITRSVTATGPTDPDFAGRWRAFLLEFGSRMRPTRPNDRPARAPRRSQGASP